MTLDSICKRVNAFIRAPDTADFEEIAREVFKFQFDHNRPYRLFCESRNVTPGSLGSSEDIPAVSTRSFKDLELSVLPADSRTAVFHSSGTTRHRPSRHFHSRETLGVYESSLLAWFKPNVMPDLRQANFLNLSPDSSHAPHSSLVHMFEVLTRTFGTAASRFCASVESDASWRLNFEQILEAINAFSRDTLPVISCGTAFSFVHLCDYLERQSLKLSFPAGSRVFETGGYKGRSREIPKHELHGMISGALNIPDTRIIAEYGMSELSSQAYDRQAGLVGSRLFRFPTWVRASVISTENGEPLSQGEAGLLRVVDLANVGSVIAVQTEDLARDRGGGFELLGRAHASETRGCSLMLADQ